MDFVFDKTSMIGFVLLHSGDPKFADCWCLNDAQPNPRSHSSKSISNRPQSLDPTERRIKYHNSQQLTFRALSTREVFATAGEVPAPHHYALGCLRNVDSHAEFAREAKSVLPRGADHSHDQTGDNGEVPSGAVLRLCQLEISGLGELGGRLLF